MLKFIQHTAGHHATLLEIYNQMNLSLWFQIDLQSNITCYISVK